MKNENTLRIQHELLDKVIQQRLLNVIIIIL